MNSIRIGMLFNAWFGYARAEVRGVLAYVRENHLPWVFAGGMDTPTTRRMLRRWKPHGLIGGPVRQAGVPVATPFAPLMGGSCVLDDDAIGRMAADHLLERGFRHLAFLGERGVGFSAARRDGFLAQWKQSCGAASDATFHTRDIAPNRTDKVTEWSLNVSPLVRWIQSLPKPLGLMAARDLCARQAVEACRQMGLRVPEDVAVVGVDNDELFCEMCDPPLSSVGVPWEMIGRAMGARMRALLEGEASAASLPVVRPAEVVMRRSSDSYATRDETVLCACRHIQAHAHESCSMAAVARMANVSRRAMERRFRRELGVSPRRMIERVRLRTAMHLLRITTLSVDQVAERSGFPSNARLFSVFRRTMKMTPRAYRIACHAQG
jgi:LacI family transcriptional regulator